MTDSRQAPASATGHASFVARAGEAGLRYLEVAVEDLPDGAPLVVGLHGRGSSPEDFAGLAVELSPEWRYLFPRAPLGLDFGPYGSGYSWFEPLPAPPAAMATARETLTAFLTQAHERYAVPPSRTALLGFSQGAVMTLDVGLRAAAAGEPYAALAAMSGYLAEADDLATILPGAAAQPLLLVHGTRDDVLGVALARRARRVLEDAGLSPEYREFDLAHEVSAESLATMRQFLQRHIRPGDAREDRA